MVNEGKKQIEVAVRMDSLDEGLPLRYEHSVYVYMLRRAGTNNKFEGQMRRLRRLDRDGEGFQGRSMGTWVSPPLPSHVTH